MDVSDDMDRVAIVTGGTGALGQAVTAALLAAGATVVVPYRAVAPFEDLRRSLGERAARLHGEPADVAEETEVARLVERTLAAYGRIDILLNLVGGFEGGRFVETGVDLWERMLRLNLRPTLLCTRAVLPRMLERGAGRIVTVGSRQALEPSAGSSAYGAAKAAVVSLTQSVAREIRTSGVTINCVVPSTIDTPANRAAMPKGDPTKWVKPEEVAALILYLCSDAAAAVNGAVIPIYGQL